MTDDDDPLEPIRRFDIPESWPKAREFRDFILRTPTDHGVTDPEEREMGLNELRVRGGDVIAEALQKLRDKFGQTDP